MRQDIETLLMDASHTEKTYVKRARVALENGRANKIEFSSDFSCVTIEYLDPTADHGLPCTLQVSFSSRFIEYLFSGIRLKSHELPRYFQKNNYLYEQKQKKAS